MFEFDDTLDDLFEDTLLPSDGDVFITNFNGRIVVARCRYLDDGLWSWDRCLNWQDLEPDATRVLKEHSLSLGDLYPCPADIVQRALWSSEVPVCS